MSQAFHQYTTHIKYWCSILSTILLFGTSLGYVGVQHAQSLPKLSLSSVAVEERFTGMNNKITDLDVRLTVIEHKDYDNIAAALPK